MKRESMKINGFTEHNKLNNKSYASSVWKTLSLQEASKYVKIANEAREVSLENPTMDSDTILKALNVVIPFPINIGNNKRIENLS